MRVKAPAENRAVRRRELGNEVPRAVLNGAPVVLWVTKCKYSSSVFQQVGRQAAAAGE